MDILQKLLAFLVVLSVLVVIHELGHYCVARWCGVKVLRFSVGFGRVVWSRRFGADRTEWALSAVPLGGYVKMADEREGDVAPADVPRAFNRQSVGKRIAIVAAGPIANLLLAVLLFAGTFVAGVPGQRALLAEPRADTPAAAAGHSRRRSGGRRRRRAGEELAGSALAAAQGVGPARGGARNRARGRPRQATSPPRACCRSRRLAMADWEGNFMPVLGLAADFGPPLIDEVIAGQAGGPRRAQGRRSHRRDRRRGRALAGRRRGAHQCQARRAGDVPDRARRRASSTSR